MEVTFGIYGLHGNTQHLKTIPKMNLQFYSSWFHDKGVKYFMAMKSNFPYRIQFEYNNQKIYGGEVQWRTQVDLGWLQPHLGSGVKKYSVYMYVQGDLCTKYKYNEKNINGIRNSSQLTWSLERLGICWKTMGPSSILHPSLFFAFFFKI